MWAQGHPQDRTPIGSDSPIARPTNLGWVLIGNKNRETGPYRPQHNVLRTQEEISNKDAAQRYNNMMRDSQINALSFDGKKEDELRGYSREDTLFLEKVIPNVRHRPDGMLEFPLPFIENRQQFPNNSRVAFCRTTSTLQNMQKKHPEVFRSTLEKFDKNLQADPPRFVPRSEEHTSELQSQ